MGKMLLLDKLASAQNNQVEGFCIVKSVAQKTNVKGAAFLDMTLGDAGGECNAKLWDYSVEAHGVYEPNTVIKVRATVNYWKDEIQLKIDRIRNVKPTDEVDMKELVPCAPYSSEEMYNALYERAGSFTDDDLRALTQYMLRENKQELLRYPAALKLHHAVRGGLLYHTSTMLKAADALAAVYKAIYPELSTELISAGIILHDIAKLNELTVGELGLASAYSTEGQLLGHINMGVAMVERAASILMTNDETRYLVEHMLLSHHGIADYGSPRPPMFPEAEIVSQVDLIDSRLYEMYDALSTVGNGGFSERQWALDNRQLYRHGHK